MKTLIAAAALGLAALAAAPPVSAHQVNGREANQQRRIEQGVRSGELTPREAAHVERQQDRINAHESRMRARNGGYLRPGQRARLARQQNRASAHIYRAKHNGRVD